MAFGYLKDPHLAEDAAQEVFLRAYGALARLRSPESFGAWILQIARNYSSRETLRSGRRSKVEEILPGKPGDVEDRAAGEEDLRAACVLELVERLPEPARHTVLLKYRQGLSCREIAEMEGVPVGTVTSRLSRALLQLREAARRAGLR
ncbi:MAG: sigma-70 family RNA polymerase sigma factor [Planctomycetota bacterium]|nr:sigma-70 family RNA polymerase sigma factor [Planctomycetota bacterium]